MISTDSPRSSFPRASRSHPQWSSTAQDGALLGHDRQQSTVSRNSRNRHSFNSARCPSFTYRSLLLIFTLILFITGGFAQKKDEETTVTKGSTSLVRLSSKTSTSKPTATPTNGNSTDEEEDGGPAAPTGPIEVDGPNVNAPVFPKAFDTNIGTNFSSTTCPAFFTVFLEDPEFQNCLPLSAMIKDSKSFFDIIKQSAFRATRVLDAACGVDFAKCAAKMEYYGREITLPERCGTEFEVRNPLVTQAYAAFLAYPALYHAGCLKSDEGSYCYIDAVTNVTNPDDSHIYYLPLGLSLPGGSRPTCSSCAQETMEEFSRYAGNRSLPLSDTYLPAAEQINIICGPQYVTTSILISSSARRIPPNIPPVALLAAIILPIMLFT